ncbi:MAG TPA: tyrosine--tRNA ligase [Thermoplasmata archaeon]|nr:tyrosine--tRNA ligase [Thermoplasmata archaeon]
MDLERRVDLVVRHSAELLTLEEIRALFERSDRPRAYIGFEPSGRLHVGHLVTARKMLDLVDAGFDLTLFLADWHAWINDKLGGSLERIDEAGRYMAAAFGAVGLTADRVRVRWARELVGRADYWSRVVRIAKATSLARTKRAMTVLGRSEEEATLDTAKLFYPSMQAADIFELPVDLAYAGLDQRRAHVLAREVAHHYGWPVPVALHTSLVSSLKGGGRMDPTEGGVERKMSKSDPASAIALPSSPGEIEAKLAAAFCPAKEVDGNPVVELARFVVFAWEGTLAVERPAKFGGNVTYETESSFLDAYRKGALHPQDLKRSVGQALVRITEPATEYFRQHPEAVPSAAGAPAPVT